MANSQKKFSVLRFPFSVFFLFLQKNRENVMRIVAPSILSPDVAFSSSAYHHTYSRLSASGSILLMSAVKI